MKGERFRALSGLEEEEKGLIIHSGKQKMSQAQVQAVGEKGSR